MEFTKEKTNIVKGVAICLMFSNHLYSFHNRYLNGNYYIPLIPFFDAEQYVGNFGNVCVSMFIFISGYGMFLGCVRSNKYSLTYTLGKLKDFYLTYWTYFLIFVPIGLFFFREVTFWNSSKIRYSTELNTLIASFLGWSSSYNGEWWFVRMFVLLLLFLCPFYISLAKQKPVLLFSISIGLFLISWVLKVDYAGAYGFIFWQISFAVGILCARLEFFSSAFIRYVEVIRMIWLFPVVLLFFIVRFRLGAKIDFLFIPIFIYLIIRATEILRFTKILAYIGKYSFPVWLVHSFFCYYYFQNFIYFPRWSPLIFVLLLSTSMLSVIVIEHIRLYLQSKLRWQTYLWECLNFFREK